MSSTAMPRRSPTSPTCGPSPATCRRAIRTGNWSPPKLKPGLERMQAGGSRAIIGLGLGLCLISGAAAQAGDTLKLRNAQAETLNFTALEGWKDDDHVAAFGAFMKSCAAILQGSKAKRAARPLYGALFKACERGVAADKPDETQAREFFEANFAPVRVMPPMKTYGYYTGADGFYTGYYEPEV